MLRLRGRGRPRKTLEQLVADGSFLARRHGELLAGEPLDDPVLSALQQLYRQAGDDRQRRRVALQFEKVCRAASPAVVGEPDAVPGVEAAEELEGPVEAAGPELSYREIIEKVWGTGRTWRDTSVSTEEAHRHSNVEHIPGSYSSPYTWPPIGEPSDAQNT
jgi:hypothetical protein